MTTKHIVSYSELDTYRQCPLKHTWAYKERWRKPPTEGGALAKGSLWHLVLETHYLVLRDGGTLEQAIEAAKTHLVDQASGLQTETQELIQWMYEGYIEHYGSDNQWEILAVEYAFVINLPDPDGNPSPYDIKGKIDLVVRNRENNQVWVVDHKSGANLPDQMDLEIDDQFGLYVWALQQPGHDKWKPSGAIHSAARTTRNMADKPGYTGKSQPQTLDQRHRRTYLNRSDVELTAIALDAWAVAANAYPTTDDRPLYSSPDPRQCGWKCDFKEVHLLSRKGKDPHRALSEYGFVQDFTRH
jgi:hypothetical protein